VVSYGDPRKARAIAGAISPDNLKVPRGLSVKTTFKGRNVLTEIACEKGLQTLISTIDDALMCMQAAEKALGSVRADG